MYANKVMRAGDGVNSYWPPHLTRTFRVAQNTLFQNLAHSANRYGDRTAIAYFGQEITYQQWMDLAQRFAGWLQHKAGVGRGDRVALYMQNCPQWLIAYAGTLRADAVVVPVSPMYGVDELRTVLRDAGATVLVSARDLAETALAAVAETDVKAIITTAYGDYLPAVAEFDLPDWIKSPNSELTGCTAWQEVMDAGLQARAPLASGEDLAILPYTSGSTGIPKGCMHSHNTFMHTAQGGGYWYGLTSATVCLGVAPMSHGSGLSHSVNVPLMAGATIVVQPRWDRSLAAQLIARYQVRHAAIAPTALVDLLANDEHVRHDLSSLSCVLFGGASMPQGLADKIHQSLGIHFIEGYGLTETAAAAIVNPLSRPKRQCLGVPFFNTSVVIADPENGNLKGVEEMGEILIHGPQVFKGYWARDDETKSSFVDIDGVKYFRTGDIGYRDTEGYHFMADRIKRMINASGFKIWPSEVENKLYEHPAIAEACVIGKKDAYRGETAKALVVLRPGAQASEADIIAWSKERMAAYKYPRSVEFVRELPKAYNGKIQWRELQAQEDARAE